MRLRKVHPKDYKKIKNLFKRNELKMIAYKRWINLWKRNPFLLNKKAKWEKGWVIEKNKNIVGHIGNYPMQYFIYNKAYTCATLCGWVVDKKFRSQSILLLKKYFSQSSVDLFLGTTFDMKTGKIVMAMNAKKVPTKNLGYSLVIIFNLYNSINYFIKYKHLPFKKILLNLVSILIMFFLKNKINYWKNKFSTKNIVRCKKFDKKFDVLWKKIKTSQRDKFLLRRDMNWLKWHLDYFVDNNKAWVFLSINNEKIEGYTICIEKKNYKKRIKSALLIDLITFNDSDKTSKNLIGANINEARKRNCDIFEFRGFNETKVKQMKFFNPFEKKLLHNPFYYKSNNKKLTKLLNKNKHWDPSYLDGDAVASL